MGCAGGDRVRYVLLVRENVEEVGEVGDEIIIVLVAAVVAVVAAVVSSSPWRHDDGGGTRHRHRVKGCACTWTCAVRVRGMSCD